MKSLYEILGTVTTSGDPGRQPGGGQGGGPQQNVNQPGTGQRQLRTPTSYHGLSNVKPLCQKMRPWQMEVYMNLRSGRSLYVTASPGGGKTLPYTCHWLDNNLRLNVSLMSAERNWNEITEVILNLLTDPGRLEKLLVTVPTRSLADQTTQEFKEFFASIITESLDRYFINFWEIVLPGIDNGNIDYHHPHVTRFGEILDALDSSGGLTNLFVRRIRLFSQVSQGARDSGEAFSSNDAHRAQLINQIDEQLRERFTEGVRRFVQGGDRNTPSLIAIRTGINSEGDPRIAPVTIAIYESAAKLAPDLIRNNLSLVIVDEAHLAQEREIQDDKRRAQIALSLYNILNHLRRSNDIPICFLSGTENPGSARNLTQYIETCLGRSITVIESTATNESNISIVPDDSIAQERELINIILRPRQGNNLIVLFSKNRIDRLTEIALKKMGGTSAFQIDRGQMQKEKASGGGVIGRKLSGYTMTPGSFRLDKQQRQEMAREASKVPGASQIFDPVLRQAVNAGFGYIYRVDDRDRYQQEKRRDAIIVADLFKSGKIKTLLATDAVGIGVNIDVRKLYIPSVDKPQGRTFKPIQPTELAQLLHRAGRGAFKFSTVVTPEKNVPAVSEALSLNPSGFNQTINIEYIPRAACTSARWFTSVWSASIGFVGRAARRVF